MSAIGSFYIINDERREELICAAEAQSKALKKKRFGFLPPKSLLNPDPFWEFIRTNAQELGDFPYSGWLLRDIDVLAAGSLSSSEDQVGEQLSEITLSTYYSYRPAEAVRATELIDQADFSNEAIKSFLFEEGREDEYPDLVGPIRDSVVRVKVWLRSVSDHTIGILSIG